MILAERLAHVFHWPATYPIRLLLPLMLVVSLLAHAAVFYLLRARAPVRGPSLPPLPARIIMLPGGADSVLLAARDPSWLDPGRYRDRLLPVPRWERPLRALQPELPPLVAAPEPAPPESWVGALPPLSVRARFEPRAAPVPPASAPVTARFDGDGPEITADVLARLRSAAPAEAPGLPTELLVVLDATGEARHVWLLRSCGVPALDAAAQRAVQLARFGPSAGGHRGVLRVVWAPAAGTVP
jgi:TonB family protein